MTHYLTRDRAAIAAAVIAPLAAAAILLPFRASWPNTNVALLLVVVVVGAGRRGVLARMAFSKVSRYCLAHAQCPVLAIPPPALARELAHGRLARVFWHRQLTAERILRDQPKPAV